MTARTNARLAGFTFLFYIAAGLTDMALSGQATAGADTAARLASISQHAPLMGVSIILTLLESVSAFVLAVTLYALTRDVDAHLALLGLCFRAGEGVLNAGSIGRSVGLLALATGGGGTSDAGATHAAASVLFLTRGSGPSAFCFIVGSTLFSWLFLRGRSIPAPLAWLGVFASVVLLVGHPAQLARYLGSPVTDFMWIPMLLFELSLAVWLMAVGTRPRTAAEPATAGRDA